ncbi:MAG: flavin reductase (DIM6/NTAB) family NADH-FMN oxidoreductase RutF [Cellvibrionaceae bacterium]|jgi:flavin reductase (DIM6/NTAB) family NADH-FMN oxidoreductase RutF
MTKLFGRQIIDRMERSFRAHFINSLSGFKSANLIGTLSKDGQSNLAIVSSVVHLGANPPLIAYINRPASVPRHTLNNILETGFYTINHVGESMISSAHQTSARYGSETSEFAATGLSEYWLEDFPAPAVAESALKIAMRYVEHNTLLNDTVMIIGEVERVEVAAEAVQEDGFIDMDNLQTVAVSGLDCYYRPGHLKRMAYAKPDKCSEELK